jgi:hypothetical protein
MNIARHGQPHESLGSVADREGQKTDASYPKPRRLPVHQLRRAGRPGRVPHRAAPSALRHLPPDLPGPTTRPNKVPTTRRDGQPPATNRSVFVVHPARIPIFAESPAPATKAVQLTPAHRHAPDPDDRPTGLGGLLAQWLSRPLTLPGACLPGHAAFAAAARAGYPCFTGKADGRGRALKVFPHGAAGGQAAVAGGGARRSRCRCGATAHRRRPRPPRRRSGGAGLSQSHPGSKTNAVVLIIELRRVRAGDGGGYIGRPASASVSCCWAPAARRAWGAAGAVGDRHVATGRRSCGGQYRPGDAAPPSRGATPTVPRPWTPAVRGSRRARPQPSHHQVGDRHRRAGKGGTATCQRRGTTKKPSPGRQVFGIARRGVVWVRPISSRRLPVGSTSHWSVWR